MQLRFHHWLIAASTLLFVSCKQKNDLGRYIPANAGVVVHIDGKSLASKLPWSEVKANSAFSELYSDTAVTATMKKVLDNPEASGIDVLSDMIVFVQKDSLGGYVSLEGKLKDEAAFKAFAKEVTQNGSASETNGINYISKAPLCVGWNKERFTYIIDAPQLGQMDALNKRMMDDSIDVSTPLKSRDLGATCRAVFDLPESNSLGVNEQFSKLLKTTGDMHFWINTEELNKGMAQSGALSMINFDKLNKGNVTTGALNFENGKVSLSMMSYAGEELTKLYKNYSGGKINEEMLKKMPGKDMVALIALNFKPEGIRELLKLMNLDGAANLMQTSLGFNLDDFVKANKGDIAFGFSDFKIAADTSAPLIQDDALPAPPASKPTFNLVFAASIGDKDAFNKLVNAGIKAGGAFASKDFPLAYKSNGTYFALGNSQQNVDQYIANSSNNSSDVVSKISGEPFGGYLNVQSLLRSFSSTVAASKDSMAVNVLNESVKIWDNILWKGGDFSDGGVAQQFDINLLDKNTNSLKVLNQYFNKIGELLKAQKLKEQQDMRAFEDATNQIVPKEDSVMAPAK